ncbi:cytochrome c oxidase subunit 3 [Nocardioides sp. WS12]|uniref:cytochrome c oxidase subunit 3 n=1 Tax=Nocardioides sp. WS12 TaxID=2486272 RepID=UPI00191F0CE2|nr:cytochrome c oxidase subunit 3 [Nocardioides sp. WS12]
MTVGTVPAEELPTDIDPAAAPESGRPKRIPGEEGLWVFILGDMAVFALFFGTILVTRGEDPGMFAAAQHELHPVFGIINTALLLTGSLFVIRGLRRLGDGTAASSRLFALTLVCALGFAAIKATEYTLLVQEGYSGGSNDFFMYYFVFTGIHLAHLVIGAIIMIFMVRTARRVQVSAGQRKFAECGAIYWHMVDLLWLVLFPLLYLIR